MLGLLLVVGCDPTTAADSPDGDANDDTTGTTVVESALTIGVFADDDEFVVAEPGMPVEVIQGPQAGIHIEVAFRIREAGAAPEKVEVVATTSLGCTPGAIPVATYRSERYIVFPEGDTVVSGTVPIIFEFSDAAAYAPGPCCVHLSVTRAGVTHSSQAELACVDDE